MARSISASKSPHSGKNWLKICAWTAGSLALLLLLILLGLWMYLNHLRNRLTATEPLQIPAVEVTANQKRQVEKVYNQVRQAIEQKRATEAVLSSQDLNALLSLAPETREASRRASLTLEGELVKATLSLPLDSVEGMRGRYLNGDFTFRIQVQDGQLQVKLLDGQTKGRPIPRYLIDKLNERDLGRELGRRLGDSQLRRLETLVVEDSQIKVRTKGGP